MAKRFTDVTTSQASKTLARRFVPLADSLRDLLTKFGLRSYRVSVIRVQWSGGRRGRGTPVVLSETVILPTPKISDMSALSEIASPIGSNENGSITLSQISGTYTEEQLFGTSSDGTPIPLDQEVHYEIEYFPHNDGPPEKRRFAIKSAPNYFPGRIQWSVTLEKTNPDRQRNGDPQ